MGSGDQLGGGFVDYTEFTRLTYTSTTIGRRSYRRAVGRAAKHWGEGNGNGGVLHLLV